MSREIKFRAWSDDDAMDFWPDSPLIEHLEIDWFKHFKDCPIMQYTGLKDKNGQEIYEGDIVHEKYYNHSYSDDKDGDQEEDKIVEWDDDTLSYYCLTPGYEYEVIGNIYENQELL